ncbi:MOSC domain-containing protein [bacterium]|nr:MOSC domain-containing protein [bacterium]MCB2178952.1 MOSC domain-containing protein [bacterium]
MNLLSINIGAAQPTPHKNSSHQTGIFKQPTPGPAEVSPEGLTNDYIGNHKHHGGPDQAIYIYGQTDYDWWANSLGDRTRPGLFGENLTIAELTCTTFNIGDELHFSRGVVLQVTSPRIPCATLAGRMEDPAFVKKFRQAERPGMYCRVLQTGTLQAGETVTVTPYAGETLSLIEMYRHAFEPDNSPENLRRLLAAPIDIRSRTKISQMAK